MLALFGAIVNHVAVYLGPTEPIVLALWLVPILLLVGSRAP